MDFIAVSALEHSRVLSSPHAVPRNVTVPLKRPQEFIEISEWDRNCKILSQMNVIQITMYTLYVEDKFLLVFEKDSIKIELN